MFGKKKKQSTGSPPNFPVQKGNSVIVWVMTTTLQYFIYSKLQKLTKTLLHIPTNSFLRCPDPCTRGEMKSKFSKKQTNLSSSCSLSTVQLFHHTPLSVSRQHWAQITLLLSFWARTYTHSSSGKQRPWWWTRKQAEQISSLFFSP